MPLIGIIDTTVPDTTKNLQIVTPSTNNIIKSPEIITNKPISTESTNDSYNYPKTLGLVKRDEINADS
jgi:hypothetical protein